MRALIGRRRLVRYFGLIAAPAVGLLALTLHSAWRQYEALIAMGQANRQLESERLATEVDARVASVIAEMLRDDTFTRLESVIQARPLEVPEAAALATEIYSKQPWVAHAVVVERGQLQWPRLRPSIATERNERDMAGPAARQYTDAIAQADGLLLRSGRALAAAVVYERAAAQPVSEALKAHALSRAARAYDQAGNTARAVDTWRTVADSYDDAMNAFEQPHALLAALAIAEASEDDALATVRLERLYSLLGEGRWPLSAEQVEYFLATLERRLGRSAAMRPRTRFLESVELARALDGAFAITGDGMPSGPGVTAVGDEGRFIVHYGPGNRPGWVLGVAVEPGRIAQTILSAIGAQEGARATLARTTARRSTGAGRAAVATLPGWHIELVRGADESKATAERQVYVVAGITLTVLLALGLGLVLLVRDVGREAQMNGLRTAFVNGVSHDLKTPLTLIRLYAESLADGNEPGPDERRRFYQIILRESERVSRMIDRVLTFSVTQSGARRYRMAPASMLDVVAACVEQNTPFLRQRGIQARVDFVEPGPTAVMDADAISDVLTNLIENAAKYSGDSRLIDVRVSAVHGAAIVEVEDHGIGIADSEQARVFEPFYRSARDDGQGGHGLGLSLVKRVMADHGGHVELESSEGRGSCFRLVFPPAARPA